MGAENVAIVADERIADLLFACGDRADGTIGYAAIGFESGTVTIIELNPEQDLDVPITKVESKTRRNGRVRAVSVVLPVNVGDGGLWSLITTNHEMASQCSTLAMQDHEGSPDVVRLPVKADSMGESYGMARQTNALLWSKFLDRGIAALSDDLMAEAAEYMESEENLSE